MNLKIISPEKVVFDGITSFVSVPGSLGPFEILKGHAPIISSLQKGSILFENNGRKTVSITSGFIEVSNDNVVACVEPESSRYE